MKPTGRGEMFGSSRSGGVRGGQDQFNWDDVKVDKHRENYLGKHTHTHTRLLGFNQPD